MTARSHSQLAASTAGDGDSKRVEDADPTALLYRSSHFRRAALCCLFLALACDVGAFVLGCLVMSSTSYSAIKHGTQYSSEPANTWTYADGSKADYEARNFFYFLFVPSIVAAITIWELDLVFRRRKLSAKRIVFTTSLSILFWSIVLPLWLSCSVFTYQLSPTGRAMCPFGFTGWMVTPESPWPTLATIYNIWLFWIPPAAITFYIPYLVFGSIAYHRKRRSRQRQGKALDFHDDHVDGVLRLGDDPALELDTRTSSLITFDRAAAHYGSSRTSSSIVISSRGDETLRWSNGVSIGETLPESEGSVWASLQSVAPSYRERARSSEFVVQSSGTLLE